MLKQGNRSTCMIHPHRSTRWLEYIPVALVLLASAVALIVVLRQPAPWALDVGEQDDWRFLSNVLPAEIARDTGTSFRWTMPEAALYLHGIESAPVLVALRIYGEGAPPGQQRILKLTYGPDWSAALVLSAGWHTYQIALPASEALEAVPLALEIKPITANDPTERGIPIDWVHMTPLPSDAFPWRALALVWLLLVVAGLLWRLDRMFAWSPRHCWLRVSVVIAICAIGCVWWSVANPSSFAWAVPVLPRSLGIATLLVFRRSVLPALDRHTSARIGLIALALLVIAQALLNAQASIGVGIASAVAALCLLPISSTSRLVANADQAGGANPFSHKSSGTRWSARAEVLILVGIFLVALGLRYYKLADLPFGLWRDEARHGLVGLRILDDPSYRPIYIANRVDLPGLGLYPFAAVLSFFGAHVWSMRLVTGLAGALAMFPCYALVRRLFGAGAVAFGAAALLAASSWHITLSRISFPTIYDPLLQLTGLWLMLVGFGHCACPDNGRPESQLPETVVRSTSAGHVGVPGRRGRGWLSIVALGLSGICFGLALQTYHTGRIGLLVAGLLAIFLLLQNRAAWPRWLRNIGIFLFGFTVAAAPLLIYAITQPSPFNERVNSLFAFSEQGLHARPPVAAFEDAFVRHLLMFNVRGDHNGRHAAPDRPMLDFVSGLGFLVGMAVLLRRWVDWRSRFLLFALILCVMPSFLAVESPHAMRSIDALPFTCVIAALGLVELYRCYAEPYGAAKWSEPRTARRRWPAIAGPAIVAIVCFGITVALNYWTYFVVMPDDPEVWTSFYPVHTQVGEFLREEADRQGSDSLKRIYVPANLMKNAVMTYLTYDLPVRTYDERTPSAAVPPGSFVIMSGLLFPKDVPKLAAALDLDTRPIQFGPTLPDHRTPAFVIFRKK